MASETAICFSSDAVNADTSPDKSSLTLHLDPAIPIPPGRDSRVYLQSFRFINHISNVSEALGNNRFVARWRAKSGLAYTNTFVLDDGNYGLEDLRLAINAALQTDSNWPVVGAAGVTSAGASAPIKALTADTVRNRVTLEIDPMWGDQPTSNSAWQLELWDAFNHRFGTQFDPKAAGAMILNRVDTTYTLKEYIYDVNNANPVVTSANIIMPKGYMTLDQFKAKWNELVAVASSAFSAGYAWNDTTKAGLLIDRIELTPPGRDGYQPMLTFYFGPGDGALLNDWLKTSNKVVRTVSTTSGIKIGPAEDAAFTEALVAYGDVASDVAYTIDYANDTTVPIPITTPDEPHLFSMLGFELAQQPISSVLSATALAPHTSHQQGLTYTASKPAHLDRSNCLRVDCDAVTGNYAPPERHSDGRSRGRSDSLAFIPITAAIGHQQVVEQSNPLRATLPGTQHLGQITISLRDQCGDKVAMDEHYSGVLILEH